MLRMRIATAMCGGGACGSVLLGWPLPCMTWQGEFAQSAVRPCTHTHTLDPVFLLTRMLHNGEFVHECCIHTDVCTWRFYSQALYMYSIMYHVKVSYPHTAPYRSAMLSTCCGDSSAAVLRLPVEGAWLDPRSVRRDAVRRSCG